jgi:hypothetical protein
MSYFNPVYSIGVLKFIVIPSLTAFMPKPHQFELEFFFSARNLCSLETIQRLALEKSQDLLRMGKEVTLIEAQVYDDLDAFGP